jgi:thioesterase domain-containing protein/acyl carrier protein
MVLDDDLGVGKQILLQLLGVQERVVHVLPGRRYRCLHRNQYRIVPSDAEDYRTLGRSLLRKKQAPSRIIDLWPLRRGEPSHQSDEKGEDSLRGLLYLLRELDKHGALNVEISVVSSATHLVGDHPFATAVEHLQRSIAAEFPQMLYRNIDVNVLDMSPAQIAVEVLTKCRSARLDRVPGYTGNELSLGTVYGITNKQPIANQTDIDAGVSSGTSDKDAQFQPLSVVPDQLESVLTAWWRELLSIEHVDLDADFFDLGGDSVAAARLFNNIQKAYNIDIGLSAIFEARTILRLAELIRQEGLKAPSSSRSSRSLVPIQPMGTRNPIYVISGLGGNVIKFYPLASHLGEDQPIFGLLPRGLDGKEPYFTRVEDMATYYADALQRVRPEGPYRLIGYSFGGLVAFEVARQIRARGGEISFLGLLDTSEPLYMETFQRTLPARERYRAYWDHLEQFSSVGHAGGRLKSLLMRKLSSAMYRLFGTFDRGVPRELARLEHINALAARRYRPSFYPGTLTLFRSAERQISEGNDETLGWEGRVGRLDVIHIQSNHFNILKEPTVSVLAEKLKPCLSDDLATVACGVQRSDSQRSER